MKVLKILEKVFLVVATVMAVFAIAFGFVLLANKDNYVESYLTTRFILGSGVVTLLLVIGVFLYFANENVARKVGTAFVVVGAIYVFAAALIGDVMYDAQVIALVAGILYVAVFLVRFIRWIVGVAKPDVEENEPLADPKIKLILKWKALVDQKVITEEEYEAKRKEIVASLDKKVR